MSNKKSLLNGNQDTYRGVFTLLKKSFNLHSEKTTNFIFVAFEAYLDSIFFKGLLSSTTKKTKSNGFETPFTYALGLLCTYIMGILD